MEQSVNKYWPLFWVIFIVAWILNAAISYNWTTSAGYVFGQSLIMFFFVRYSKTPGGVRASYGVFIMMLIILFGQKVSSTHQEITAYIMVGCVMDNPAVAAFSTEEKKTFFCSCLSQDISWTLLRELSVSFLSFQEFEGITDNPTFQAKSTLAWNKCIPLVEG